MDDKTVTSNSSKRCMMDEKLDEATLPLQLLRDHYKRILPEEIYYFFERKSFYVQMLWRNCPEKLLYPALIEWDKALEKGIDPFAIFQLAWHTGSQLEELKARCKASIKGRLHRTGVKTDGGPRTRIDPKLHEVYEEYVSQENKPPEKKKSLNQLLISKFGIKNLQSQKAELSRYRAKFYRVKKALDRGKFQEDIPDDDNSFFTAYLEYILRHYWIRDFIPEEDRLDRIEAYSPRRRTKFDHFIHENADANLKEIAYMKIIERMKKKRQRFPRAKRDGKVSNEIGE